MCSIEKSRLYQNFPSLLQENLGLDTAKSRKNSNNLIESVKRERRNHPYENYSSNFSQRE